MNENKYLDDLDDDFVSKQPIYKDISNFSDLDSLIKSGKKEIILENDIILDLNCNEKEKYADGIKITTNNLVIDGKGYSIDALGKVSIFETMGKNITIRNLTLKNGFNEVKGGAVSNYDELLIDACNFLENTSQDIGGAVYNHDNTNLTINKSKFYNNEAKNSQLLSLGGVIYNNGGLIKIIDSDFKYNTSDIAGAIFNCNWGHISIDSSILSHNKAYIAGCINVESQSEIIIINTDFIENESLYAGAIFKNHQTKLIIKKSSFLNNYVNICGGVISLYDENCLIEEDCRFEGNKPNNIFIDDENRDFKEYLDSL